MSDKTYTGRISNAGTQVVTAPVAPKGRKATVTARHGDDLRVKSGNQK